MKSFHKILIITALVLPSVLWGGSTKRGVCWDESAVKINAHHVELLSPGVCWVYNWGPDAGNSAVYSEDFSFQPMAWNGAYNESRIRSWLDAHPETRWLLAFNEPNFADQARMTPADAASAWPALEAIAAEYGLRLVAPALNFSNSQVGGRVWNPYEWYDEFFRLLPNAKVDCLAMHCYMNWYSANTWLATEYFYSDLYNSSKECYGRYPNLVRFLDSYKERNGSFPKMMLTEFCSWENDGSITGVDFQIDQMTQKVQMLERSDLIEGYAWFMANPSSGASAYPYMSLLQTNSASSELSELGKVYTYMSEFDTERHYAPGETIAAKDYVNATTDNRQIKVRSNSDAVSDIPLQTEYPQGAYADYLIDVPQAGLYRISCRVSAAAAGQLALYIDNKRNSVLTIPATSGAWTDVEVEAQLPAGKHTLTPYNTGSASVLLNALSFAATAGVESVTIDGAAEAVVEIITLQGVSLGNPDAASLAPGLYLVRRADGSSSKFIK